MSQITNSLLVADRRALDEVVFEVVGLTPTTVSGQAVCLPKPRCRPAHEAVINLVRARLEKAKSV